MQEAKNTPRALVKIGYDGTVHKFFRAANAQERFDNELRVLQYLERRGCDFVPRVLGYDRETLELITSNCGPMVQQLSDERMRELFADLEKFGVRHDDPYLRNITYRRSDGRFCVIDFEFATILEPDAALAGESPLPATSNSPACHNGRLRWSGCTECGGFRSNNEDAFLTVAFNQWDFTYLAKSGEVPTEDFDFVFAVSDGMGGERSGEFASKFALDNITRLLPRRYSLAGKHNVSGLFDCLDDLFDGIHRQLTLLGESYDEGKNMGATLSLIWVVDGRVFFGHIGDSRIYLLPRTGGIRQITEDHTHVGWLRRQGQLNEREARNHPRKNVLSQSLGSGNRYVNPQVGEISCQPGDSLLLCTDGITDGLWDRALNDLYREPDDQQQTQLPAPRLVQAALKEGSRDNTTALLVEFPLSLMTESHSV
ncbi:MAG: protein phosphatase 2C domain-containing protein [Planctomycetaceae bacterium]